MRFRRSAVAVCVAVATLLIVGPALGQVTLDAPLAEAQAYGFDSGELSNRSPAPRRLHEEVVRIDGAAWMRLYFGDVVLGEGSFLRVTSELDGEVQELDAAALEMWNNSTAYFNGDTVFVELIAGPGTLQNRLVIDEVASAEGAVPIGGCGICGPDDRVSSEEDFAARLLPAGCSATVYNSFSCMVSAGHCISGGMVVQFKVPLSNANCSLNHPPISEQFPVTAFSFTNGGVGNDWSVMTTGTNNQGEQPFDRYGAKKSIATTLPSVGQSLTIWGYGVDSQCIFSQTQQTSGGVVTSVGGTSFNHNVDATFGNSGSSLIRDGQEILGIATHCPCPNWATRIDHPSFSAARENLCPEAVPEAAALLTADVIIGAPISTPLSSLTGSDDIYFTVEAIAAGPRHSTLSEVAAQLPTNDVSDLIIDIEFGMANASPVFYILQVFNDEAGMWESLNFGIAATTQDSLVTSGSLSNPNAYVTGEGVVRVRVGQTARQSQTPAGFTKLIDHVQVLYVD